MNHLKPFVNSAPQWTAFEEYVKAEIEGHQRAMLRATEPVVLYRAQGSIMALERLLLLKDVVNAS